MIGVRVVIYADDTLAIGLLLHALYVAYYTAM